MTTPQHRHAARPCDDALNAREVTTVQAICDRLASMLGPVDRAGLLDDFAIVQSHCPLDLDALLAAPDRVFIDELMSIIDATDRDCRSLRGAFQSRFGCDGAGMTLLRL